MLILVSAFSMCPAKSGEIKRSLRDGRLLIAHSDDASSHIEFAEAVIVVDCLFSKNAALIWTK
jgi:hypothetical protein